MKSQCCNAPIKLIKATHWPVITRWICTKCGKSVTKEGK